MPFLPGPHAPGAPPIWDILQNLPRKFLFFSFYISYFTIVIPCIIRRSLSPIHFHVLEMSYFSFYSFTMFWTWTFGHFFTAVLLKICFFGGGEIQIYAFEIDNSIFPLSRGHVWSGPALSTPTTPCSRAAASWRGLYLYLNLCFILDLFFYKMYLSVAPPRSYD